MALIDFLFRWGHVLFGITWIGLLYYFNFVQGEYFKEAEASAKADATRKLAPRALWWFRWGAMFTFLTGLYLLYALGAAVNQYITLGALMGIFMFLNVWLIIWPAQKIVIGLSDGDAAKAGPEGVVGIAHEYAVLGVPCCLACWHRNMGPTALPALPNPMT